MTIEPKIIDCSEFDNILDYIESVKGVKAKEIAKTIGTTTDILSKARRGFNNLNMRRLYPKVLEAYKEAIIDYDGSIVYVKKPIKAKTEEWAITFEDAMFFRMKYEVAQARLEGKEKEVELLRKMLDMRER
jgi:hypothetical protein